MKKLFLKKCFSFVALMAMLIAVFIVTSFAASTPSVVFSDFQSADGKIYDGKTILPSEYNINEQQVVITRDGGISDNSSLSPVVLTRSESKNGCINYSSTTKFSKNDNYDVTMPVVYVEEDQDVSAYRIGYEPDKNFTFSVYNSSNIAKEAANDYIIFRCDFDSAEVVPYECSLNIDNIEYPIATCDIYFDEETGEASRAYFTFFGVDTEITEENAHICVESVMKKYVATDYTIK